RVPGTQALHGVLDRLFADLRMWAQLLAEQDQALGVSPLASMSTGQGRTPPNPWHGGASDAEVRRIVGEHLSSPPHTGAFPVPAPARRVDTPNPGSASSSLCGYLQ
ncbi:MAG: hypothetical protein ACR2MP_18105, partial [Streptosporangiaceae bacterium]